MLLIAFISVTIIILRLTAWELIGKWGYTISKVQIVVDEDLPSFFEAVKLSDADWVVHENKNLKENYGFSMVTEEVEQRLDDLKLAKKTVRGVTWYNILANPYYARLFNYIEVNVPSRSDLIVDGDDDEENDCE